MESIEVNVDGVKFSALRGSLCVPGSALEAIAERWRVGVPIQLSGFRPEAVGILLNWLTARWLTSLASRDSSEDAHVDERFASSSACITDQEAHADAPASCATAAAAPRGAVTDALLRRTAPDREADCDSGPLPALSTASTASIASSSGASSSSSSHLDNSTLRLEEAADLFTDSSSPPNDAARAAHAGYSPAPERGLALGASCGAAAVGERAALALPSASQARPAAAAFLQLPPPVLPPQLQPELDLLIDFLGLTGAVYGARVPHLSYGTPLPYLLARYGARPLFTYRSSPSSALVLDGSCLQLHARGYAHASALLEPASGAARAAAAVAAPSVAAFAGSKLLWKLRVSRHGCSSSGNGSRSSSSGGNGSGSGSSSCCRADTSLGVLVVHVEGEAATAGDAARVWHGSSSSTGGGGGAATTSSTSSGSGIPVISAAAAAAWAGPLPLLAAGLSPTGVATAGGLRRAASSTLHAPGFFGWHMAGLARSFEPGCGGGGTSGSGAGDGTGGSAAGGCGILTKLPLHQMPSPFAAGGTVAAAAAAAGTVAMGGGAGAANPLGGSAGRGLLRPDAGSNSGSSSSSDDRTDSGCSRDASPGLFFQEGDVLLFAMDTEARRLELHHGRLGQTFSVALPPAPLPPPSATAAAAAAAGMPAAGGCGAAAPPGVREVLYAHVCMYDRGEGVEVLEVGVDDLQRMGCV